MGEPASQKVIVQKYVMLVTPSLANTFGDCPNKIIILDLEPVHFLKD